MPEPKTFRIGLHAALVIGIMMSVVLCGLLVHLTWWKTTTEVSRTLLGALEGQIAESTRRAWWGRITETENQLHALKAALEGTEHDDARAQAVASSALATGSLSWLVFIAEAGDGIVIRDHGTGQRQVDVFRIDGAGKVLASRRVHRNGEVDALAPPPFMGENPTFHLDWMQIAPRSLEPIWISLDQDPSGQGRAVALVSRTRVGTLYAVIHYDQLARILGEIPVGRSGRAFVLAPDGAIVLEAGRTALNPPGRVEQAARKAGRIVAARAPHDRDTSESRRIEIDGHAFSVDLSPLSFQGWQLAIIVPEADYLAEVDQAIGRVAIGLVFFVVVAGLIGALGTRVLVAGPIGQVVGDLALVERFELEAVPRRRSRLVEIDQLSEAIVRMSSGLADFGKFIPAELVRTILNDGMRAEPGGSRRRITVLFADLAGFTALSEQMGDAVVPVVGRFLDLAAAAITDHGGTVDKYIGDAAMAFWGAPRDDDAQEINACRAAFELQRGFERLQATDPVFARMHVRIGIQSGYAIVGNVGSSHRLNYTALGDTVNLASRLEGVNKIYGTTILIGPETAARLDGRMILREIDTVVVYGRMDGVTLHELVAPTLAQSAPEWVALYAGALNAYRGREFGAALDTLEHLLGLKPADGPALRLAGLCRWLIAVPPPIDWTPTTTLDMK